MSNVYSVRVDESMDSKLNYLVAKTGHKKAYFIKKALKYYLEDKEDYFKAIEAIEAIEKGESVSDWEEVKKRLEL